MTQLTVFRAKSDVTDPDDILIERDSLMDFPVAVDGSHLGVLYVKRTARPHPDWVSYFGNSIELSDGELATAAVGAVLLLAHKGHTYAVVFGSGRYLLAQDALEHRFGLRVTLNAVEPTQLRSVDHRRLDTIARHTREELSRAAGVEQFGLDVERDLLRAVTGTPVDPAHGRRLSGADQLSVIGDIPLSKLTKYLDTFSTLAAKQTYKSSFPWVDNIFEITDPVLVHQLDEQLVKVIKKDAGDCWLAPPEIVDWTNVASFKYRNGKTAKFYDDIEFSGYAFEHGSLNDLTVGRLNQDRVYCVNSDDESMKRSWSIYRCIIGEISHKAGRYILSEGKWYRVDVSFLEALDKFIDEVPFSPITFPKCSSKREDAYNKAAAKKLQGLQCLDQDFVNVPGRGKIEVCDLYSADRVFVHVKKYGASSTLSHLFSQGTVSAQLMVAEPSFREAFYKKLPPSHHWGDPLQALKAADFEVCFAVIARSGKDFSLPFFSRVNFRTAVRTIKGLGMKVSRAHVARP